MKNNNFFKLYPNVIPVKGYNRSMLLDLYFGRFFFIPNSMVDLLKELEISDKKLSEFLSQFNDENKETIFEYLEFIISHNLGLKCDETLKESLKPIKLDFQLPYLIENVIFELDIESLWLDEKVFEKLETVLAKFLEVRFLDSDSFFSNIDFILFNLKKAFIESVEILVPYSDNLKEKLNEIIEKHPRLWKITVYDANEGFDLESNEVKLFFTKQMSIADNHCGNISPAYFSIDTQSFLRNSNYNNCTAYKLSISKEGIIKNCPSNETSYGHISETDLYDFILNKPEFKETWNITKDQIDVCKDCEYRMICSDCRVFIDDKNNKNSRPEKCFYNPYISKWEGESGYQNLEDTGIVIYDNKLSINHEKIADLNNEIWN